MMREFGTVLNTGALCFDSRMSHGVSEQITNFQLSQPKKMVGIWQISGLRWVEAVLHNCLQPFSTFTPFQFSDFGVFVAVKEQYLIRRAAWTVASDLGDCISFVETTASDPRHKIHVTPFGLDG